MCKIVKLDKDPSDPFAPHYAVQGETGIVIRTFEQRQSAIEWLDYARKAGDLT